MLQLSPSEGFVRREGLIGAVVMSAFLYISIWSMIVYLFGGRVLGSDKGWGGEVRCLQREGRLWKVLLQAQFGAEGVDVEVDVEERLGVVMAARSQCFFEKTGTSEKAQKRWSLMRALDYCQLSITSQFASQKQLN